LVNQSVIGQCGPTFLSVKTIISQLLKQMYTAHKGEAKICAIDIL